MGTVSASWDGESVELHAFAAHLDDWADKVVSHETLTEAVADYLKSQGASDVTVTTRWSTAGFDVGVTT